MRIYLFFYVTRMTRGRRLNLYLSWKNLWKLNFLRSICIDDIPPRQRRVCKGWRVNQNTQATTPSTHSISGFDFAMMSSFRNHWRKHMHRENGKWIIFLLCVTDASSVLTFLSLFCPSISYLSGRTPTFNLRQSIILTNEPLIKIHPSAF